MSQSPNPDWMSQWQDLSQNYLNAWQTISRNLGAAQPTVAQPSSPEGFEQWSRLFAPTGGAQSETIERIVDSARNYAAFLQAAIAAIGGNAGNASMWNEKTFQTGFGVPGFEAFSSGHPLLRALREAPWAQSGGLESMFAAMRGGNAGAFSGDLAELKAWLNLPAFGLMREHQEHSQKMAVGWIDYQEQMGRYNALMLKAAQRGFEIFQGKLTEREQPGRQIESLRALYDLWVDAAEEGYAEIALSQDFREIYAALVNAQMRVRAQIQQEVERTAASLGMPTRSELNSIGERLQALRREVRARGNGVSEKNLAGELASLREEFSAFKASVRQARPVPTVKSVPVAAASVPSVKPKVVPIKSSTPLRGKKAKRGRPLERAVAATAAGAFASRIAKFADASLGTARAHAKRAKTQSKIGKPKKKR